MPQFVPHFRCALQHLGGRFGFDQCRKPEAGRRQAADIRGGGSVVLGYFFSEENGLPFFLKKIIVDRPVFFVSLFVITPVLFSLSRKNGIFDGKHETDAGG